MIFNFSNKKNNDLILNQIENCRNNDEYKSAKQYIIENPKNNNTLAGLMKF